jgi:phosphate transport system substrate-binding protein
MQIKWIEEYQRGRNVRINYQSQGSSAGQKGAMDRSFDFGCSEAVLTDEMLFKAREAGGEMLHIPLIMGAVVAAYNVPDLNDQLRFNGPALADIFLGKIKKWNDPAIAALNPGIQLPATEISVVHRSDGSGTTNVWTDYLSKVSPDWKAKVGVGNSVNWPVGKSSKGNEGVAGLVKRTTGSIGYLELTYALRGDIEFGMIKNRAGRYVQPSLSSVTWAADEAMKHIPDDLRYTLTDSPGKHSYPIVGTCWALVYVQQPSDKKQALVDYLRWCVNDGQRFATDLGMAPLPKTLVDRIAKKLDQIRSR